MDCEQAADPDSSGDVSRVDYVLEQTDAIRDRAYEIDHQLFCDRFDSAEIRVRYCAVRLRNP